MKEFMLLIRNGINHQSTWTPEHQAQFLKSCETYIGKLKKDGESYLGAAPRQGGENHFGNERRMERGSDQRDGGGPGRILPHTRPGLRRGGVDRKAEPRVRIQHDCKNRSAASQDERGEHEFRLSFRGRRSVGRRRRVSRLTQSG